MLTTFSFPETSGKEQDLPHLSTKDTASFSKLSVLLFHLWLGIIQKADIFVPEPRKWCVMTPPHKDYILQKGNAISYVFSSDIKKFALDFVTFIISTPKAPL